MAKRQEQERSQEKPENFEAAMDELEQLVAKMESGQAPLEESLQLFERGTFLIKHCQQRLDSAETQIRKLIKGRDGVLAVEPSDNE